MFQKLMQNGYTLCDIREMVNLFQSSFDNYQEIFKQENQHKTLIALHKLKGGLKILQFSELLNDIDYLEKGIKLNGINHYKTFLIKLIEECVITSNQLLSAIDASQEKMNDFKQSTFDKY